MFILLLLFLFFFTENYMVVAGSMNPGLVHGDRCVSFKLSFNPSTVLNDLAFSLKRQDIIIFQRPQEREILIKRLIGLPGDVVELSGQDVRINGKLLKESYKLQRRDYISQTYKVPAGNIFVMGDNRDQSRDSRKFGFIAQEQVRGKIILCYFPFKHFRLF